MRLAQLTRKEDILQFAYTIWYYLYFEKYHYVDDATESLLNVVSLRGRWLRYAREAQNLTTQTVAERIRINRSAYSKIEEREELGAVTIATLEKAAEALDCELVYGLRPKANVRFSRLIWQKLEPYAATLFDQKIPPTAHAIAELARELMDDVEFRKLQKWSKQTFITPRSNYFPRRYIRGRVVQAIEKIKNQYSAPVKS